MGLYNWIELERSCSHCGSSPVRVQCHVATSGAADQDGRFSMETYRLGERMRWWSILSENWASWFNGADIALFQLKEAVECCYGSCHSCKKHIYAVIRFKDCAFGGSSGTGESIVTPVEVLDFGYEGDEPDTMKMLTMYEKALSR